MIDPTLLEGSTHKEPQLWIERVVLYRTDVGWPRLQDIPFKRGVNIIWGKGTAAEADTEKGHSVGKTTLLRLIRYALGEDDCGSDEDRANIAQSFPRGHVGVTLHLCGVKWSVIRDIGINGRNVAAKDLPLEALTQLNPDSVPYEAFEKAIHESFVTRWEFQNPPKSDRDYHWKHLLAWMIRDQDARYRDFHIWADKRSGSTMPQFKYAKPDAMHFVRMILDATRKDEYKLEQQLAQIEEDIEKDKVAAKESADFQKARKKVLENLIQACLPDTLKPQIEFRDLKDRGRAYLEGRYNHEREIRAGAEESLRLCLIKINEINQAVKSVQDALELDKSRRSLPKELTENDFCPILRCKLRTCDKFLKRVNDIKQEILALQLDGKLLSPEDQATKITERLELTQDLNNLRVDEADIRRKFPAKTEACDQAKSALTNYDQYWEQWDSIASVSDAPSGSSQANLNRLQLKADIDAQLLNVRLDLAKTRETLSQLYGSLCTSILGPGYGGEIDTSPKSDAFDFQITSTGTRKGRHGAAVTTLSSHIMDITPLICRAKEKGFHPGFLIHDSPREADMTEALYSRYLKGIRELSDAFGGETCAPFQYIISTTTEPPKELSDTIRVTLASHPHSELLFKQLLGQTELDLA